MCSDLTPTEKAKYRMVQDIREEYGGSGGARRKVGAVVGKKVRYYCVYSYDCCYVVGWWCQD